VATLGGAICTAGWSLTVLGVTHRPAEHQRREHGLHQRRRRFRPSPPDRSPGAKANELRCREFAFSSFCELVGRLQSGVRKSVSPRWAVCAREWLSAHGRALFALATAPALNAYGVANMDLGPVVGWVAVGVMIGGLAVRLWSQAVPGRHHRSTPTSYHDMMIEYAERAKLPPLAVVIWTKACRNSIDASLCDSVGATAPTTAILKTPSSKSSGKVCHRGTLPVWWSASPGSAYRGSSSSSSAASRARSSDDSPDSVRARSSTVLA
jgi:hypothetical protein